MKIEIQIERRHLAYLVFTLAILMAVSYVFAAAPNPGHSWNQIGDLPAALANIDSTQRIRMADVGCAGGWDTSCDSNNNGYVNYADSSGSAGSVPWSGVTSKPTIIYSCSTCRGTAVYKEPAGCGSEVSTSSTCSTEVCFADKYTTRYNNCGGTWCGPSSPESCSNTFLGYLLP